MRLRNNWIMWQSKSTPHKQRKTFPQSALSLSRNSKSVSLPCSASSLNSCASATFSFRFTVCAYFTAGPRSLPGSNTVSVADVVASGQQEVSATILTTAGTVAVHQTTVEVSVQKAHEVCKLHLLRNHKLTGSIMCFSISDKSCSISS